MPDNSSLKSIIHGIRLARNILYKSLPEAPDSKTGAVLTRFDEAITTRIREIQKITEEPSDATRR